jgi:hypothetical protein
MNFATVKAWETYFKDIGIQPELCEAYIPFVRSCIERKIPPIFENEHLALLLGIDLSTLTSMVEGTESFYRRQRSTFHAATVNCFGKVDTDAPPTCTAFIAGISPSKARCASAVRGAVMTRLRSTSLIGGNVATCLVIKVPVPLQR